MAEETKPSFTVLIVCAAIIIGIMITVLILHRILWDIAGWTLNTKFFVEQTIMVGWGIVLPAILIVIAVVGSKIFDQSEYIPLIFGIIITVLGGLFILASGFYMYFSISDTIQFVPTEPQTLPIYVALIIFAIASLPISIIILMRGIKLITYYTSKS